MNCREEEEKKTCLTYSQYPNGYSKREKHVSSRCQPSAFKKLVGHPAPLAASTAHTVTSSSLEHASPTSWEHLILKKMFKHRKTRNSFVVMWQCVRNCMCFVKHHLFRKSCGLGSRCLQWCMAFISVVSTLSAAKLPRHPIDLLGSNIRNPGAVRVWSTAKRGV